MNGLKKWVLMLALVCNLAHADTWGEAKNNAGGKILLTPTPCKGKDAGHIAFSTSAAGVNITGCWFYFADMVHILWADGTSSSYDGNTFTVKESR